MTLIKFDDCLAATKVRALDSGADAWSFAREPLSASEVERLLMIEEIADLNRQLQAREAELELGAQNLPVAVAAAEAKGHQAGLEAGRERGEKALNQLGLGMEVALRNLSAQMTGMECLAVGIAKWGLEKILGPSADRSRLIVDLISRQVEELEDGAILQIDVSAADFPNELAVLALRDSHAALGSRIKVRDRLAAGDCSIKLELGGIEIGLSQQWDRLSTALDELAEPEPDA